MTTLMQQVIERLEAVPSDAQDAIARAILAELRSRGLAADGEVSLEVSVHSTAAHATRLRRLAEEARADFHAGSTVRGGEAL